jgi:hypothetical protein
MPDRMPDHKDHDAGAQTPATKPDRNPTFFHGRDYETLARLTDLIIPRTDTPGASDVGVPWRIDQAVAHKPDLQPLYQQGLAELNSAARKKEKPDFLALNEDDQVAALTAVAQSQDDFFKSLKSLTIEWYYNSQEGLVHELGFKGDTFRTQFTGCTHPEHWPVQKG